MAAQICDSCSHNMLSPEYTNCSRTSTDESMHRVKPAIYVALTSPPNKQHRPAAHVLSTVNVIQILQAFGSVHIVATTILFLRDPHMLALSGIRCMMPMRS